MTNGRPTKFKKEMLREVTNYCLLGATDEDLAKFLDVDVSTISSWKNSRPEFLEAIKEGKEIADANVGKSLYQRATGYSHPDVHISNYQGDITITDITKHYPPDATSAIFWLKNRQKDKWRDLRAVEHSGEIISKVQKLTDEELDAEIIKHFEELGISPPITH